MWCDKLLQSCLLSARLLCPWDSPGRSTGVSCLALLQEILWTQGSNPRLLSLLRWQAGSLPLASPVGYCKSHSVALGSSILKIPFPLYYFSLSVLLCTTDNEISCFLYNINDKNIISLYLYNSLYAITSLFYPLQLNPYKILWSWDYYHPYLWMKKWRHRKAKCLVHVSGRTGIWTRVVESIFLYTCSLFPELYLNFCKTESMAPFAPIFFLKKV